MICNIHKSLVRHKKKQPHPLYKLAEPWMESCKIFLQFFIGFSLVLLLVIKALYFFLHLFFHLHLAPMDSLVALDTLELVAKALAYSAGIELAYMLFTDGPDEAIEPVIMGLAAAILLGLSKLLQPDFLQACGVIILVLALGALFIIRQYTIEKWGNELSSEIEVTAWSNGSTGFG